MRRLSEAELAYLFKHTLTQETAYESLLLKKRREIHLRVAESYEHFYSDRLDELAPLLAQHYSEGGDDGKTLEYEARAGDVAARRYANAEAFVAYSHALEIALRLRSVGGTPIHDLYVKRGRVLELSGRYSEAISNYDEMERTARARGDRALELASLMARATLCATPTPVHDPGRANSLLTRALALARELGDPEAEAKGFWNLMLLNKFTLHPLEATKFGEQALAIARKHNLREQMAFILNDLAVHAYIDTGDFEAALRSTHEAIQLWREFDNQPMLADSFVNSAQTHALLGQYDQAIQESQEARIISDRISNLWGESYSRFIEGFIYFERGEVDQAIKVMTECIDLGEQAGFVVPSVKIRSDLAMLYGTIGNVERGIEAARLSHKSAETRMAVWRALPLATIARLELLRGRIHDAERALEEMQIDLESDYLANLLLLIAAPISLARAQLALAQVEYGRAEGVIGKLLERLSPIHARMFLSEALFVRAQVLFGQGRPDEALGSLEEARTVAQAIGSRRMLWRILAALSESEGKRGNEEKAIELRAEARIIVEYIADHVPAELRPSFLNLPDVGRVFQS